MNLLRKFLSGVAVFALVASTAVFTAPEVSANACATTVIRPGSRGTCVAEAQRLLIQRGHTVGSAGADGVFGAATANAALNFQRSQGLYDDAVIGSMTWARLITPAAISTAIPAACKTTGVVLCASQATRKLHYVQNGAVVKTVDVRFGGYARGTDGVMRIYRTAKGTFSVYGKELNSWSYSYKVYLPYSLKFNGGQYFHQSNDFAATGYAGASHGCVNIASATDAKWFYDNTPTNTKVHVY